ncbi:hypothetical protein M0R45_009239 [Rubus argutus]|uniref:NAC domain-containing protein n=1 Tax=Rubus argutus TaxID=59490 RepID=A0AAW1Y2Z9_RUBAR
MVSEDDVVTAFCDGQFWQPGFRFHPTDEELVLYYLKRKICKKRLKLNVIAETDVYKWDPEELPGLSLLKTGDRQWFFFSPRDRKYPNGGRSNRATRQGYWKATGKDRIITCYTRSVGLKKTLVFYKGRAPTGERTDWVMHEYTLDEEELKRCQNVQEYYALYKVFKKSGPGPKNGEQYGAPFREEDWADDECPVIISSADRENSVKQVGEVTANYNVKHNGEIPLKQVEEITSDDYVQVNSEVHSTLGDLEEFMKQIADDALDDLPQFNGYAHTLLRLVVSEEETQSTIVDLYSSEVVCPQPMRTFDPIGQQGNTQASFDFTQSQMQMYEASEVTSASDIHQQEPPTPILREEDFLEMDDLLGPEPTISNIGNSEDNLKFDELDGFDLFQDAAMFFNDMGPIEQGTVSHQFMNSMGLDFVNQFDYQIRPAAQNQNNHQLNPESTQINDQLWAQNEGRDHFTSAESIQGSLPHLTSGVLYESSNHPTQANQNQSSNEAAGVTSQFSSALWSFVESIPTTPASASENALVNRAFERMSSFSRMRIIARSTNVTAGNGSDTIRKRGFFFLPVLVALCAIFWVVMATLRQWGGCISS